MELMETTLRENLNGATTQTFRERFVEMHTSREDLEHDTFLSICIAKRVIHHATRNGYRISLSNNYTYQGGTAGATQMVCQTFNLEHTGQATTHDLYPNEVLTALTPFEVIE
jgi:hypothetical protein